MRFILITSLVVGATFAMIGCNRYSGDRECQSNGSCYPIQQSDQLISVGVPDTGLKAPIVDGPTKKQITEDVNNRKIEFDKNDVWTFAVHDSNVDVLDVKKVADNLINVDVLIKVNTKRHFRSGRRRYVEDVKIESVVRVMYERCGSRWIAKTVVGLQLKQV
jgi:hypothetical protein